MRSSGGFWSLIIWVCSLLQRVWMCLLKRFMEKGTYNKTVEPIGVSRSALFRIQHLDRLTPMAHLFRLPANDAGKRADKPPACSHVTGRCTVARRARDAGQPLIALNVRSTVLYGLPRAVCRQTSGWSRPSRTFFRALGVSAGGSSARWAVAMRTIVAAFVILLMAAKT